MRKSNIGPVQLLAIRFDPTAKYEGKILKELERLDRIKTIRILDLLFVQKDKKSKDLLALSIQEEKLGAIVGALMGFDFKNDHGHKKQQKATNEFDDKAFGLSTKQIEEIGEKLEPGTAAGILLIEHVWARDLKQAIRKTGGVPIAEGFLTPEAIETVAEEIILMSNTMNDLEEESQENRKTKEHTYA